MERKIKREIVISQQTKDKAGINPISVLVSSKRLLDSGDIKVSDKIGALILGKQILDDLKDQVKNLEEQLTDASYEDVVEALTKEGVLDDGEIPVFSVINKAGKKTSMMLSKTTSHSLNMDDFKETVKDPAIFDALPEDFKKTDLKGVPYFTSLYKAGKIPSVYESMFHMEDKEKISMKSIKMKEEEDK